MNSRIQQIMAMHKAGILTDEQSAQLIEELLKTQTGPAGAAARPSETFPRSAPEPLGAIWHKAVSRSVEAIVDCAQSVQGRGAPDLQGNTIHLSHFEYPEGTGLIFSGNAIRMSKLRELNLERSEMSDNRFDACRLQEIRLGDAKLEQSHFNSSSVSELLLDHSEICRLELFSSKWSEVKIKEDSSLQDVQMRSSVAKEVAIVGRSHWADSSFNSVVFSEVTGRATQLTHCRIDET